MTTQRMGMVGLGLLGTALAELFLMAGYEVSGYDLDPSRRQFLTERGGHAVINAIEAAADCRYLVFCLPTSAIVQTVLSEIEATLHSGLILVDTTTGDPEHSAAVGAQLAA